MIEERTAEKRPTRLDTMSYREIHGTYGPDQTPLNRVLKIESRPIDQKVDQLYLHIFPLHEGKSAWKKKEAVRLHVKINQTVETVYVKTSSVAALLGRESSLRTSEGWGKQLAAMLRAFNEQGRGYFGTSGASIKPYVSEVVHDEALNPKKVVLAPLSSKFLPQKNIETLPRNFVGDQKQEVKFTKGLIARFRYLGFKIPRSIQENQSIMVEAFWELFVQENAQWNKRLPDNITPDEALFLKKFFQRNTSVCKREREIQQQLNNPATQLQLLYLSSFSASSTRKQVDVQSQALEAVFPDTALLNLYNNLEEFANSLSPSSDVAHRQKVQQVLQKLDRAKELYLRVGLLLHETDPVKKTACMEQIVQKAVESVAHLDQGESCILPGGYSEYDKGAFEASSCPGHIVAYEVKKNFDGTFRVTIFDSQSVENADQAVAFTKKPNMFFDNIPVEKLDKVFFTRLYSQALGSRKNRVSTSMSQVYDQLLRLGSPQFDDSFHYDQGEHLSCMHQCLIRWLKNSLDNPRLYKSFKKARLRKYLTFLSTHLPTSTPIQLYHPYLFKNVAIPARDVTKVLIASIARYSALTLSPIQDASVKSVCLQQSVSSYKNILQIRGLQPHHLVHLQEFFMKTIPTYHLQTLMQTPAEQQKSYDDLLEQREKLQREIARSVRQDPHSMCRFIDEFFKASTFPPFLQEPVTQLRQKVEEVQTLLTRIQHLDRGDTQSHIDQIRKHLDIDQAWMDYLGKITSLTPADIIELILQQTLVHLQHCLTT